MTLDPTAAFLLKQIPILQETPLHKLSPQEAREKYSFAFSQFKFPAVPVKKVKNKVIQGPYGKLPIRIYTPKLNSVLPTVIYFHGGGWVLGNLDICDDLCRRLAVSSECIVVSVDYGLAPEHKFPAPVEEGYAAVKWVAENAGELGADGNLLAVGGDSAGGNIAAAVTLLARDRSGPNISFQLLIYPATDLVNETQSKREKSQGYLLDMEFMKWFLQCYLEDDSDAYNPLASPLLAENLQNLPSALIITAEHDPLLDDGKAYAKRLAESGNQVEYKMFKGMIHGFAVLTCLFDQAQEAIDLAAGELRNFTKSSKL